MMNSLISHFELDNRQTSAISPEVINYHCNLYRQLVEQEQIIAQLQDEIHTIQSENQALKTTLTTLEICIENYEAELRLLKAENEDLISQSSSLKSQNEHLKQENKKLTSQIHRIYWNEGLLIHRSDMSGFVRIIHIYLRHSLYS